MTTRQELVGVVDAARAAGRPLPVIDIHTHFAGVAESGNGCRLSKKQRDRLSFRLLFAKHGLNPKRDPEHFDAKLRALYVADLEAAPSLDYATVLAFDAVYDEAGARDEHATHLYVPNDYAAKLARSHPKLLWAAGINPRRPDALDELDRVVELGCVMLKWLPLTQGFDPSNRAHDRFYQRLADHRLPLLSHTGSETALVNLAKFTEHPNLLERAADAGVTVIAAHCATTTRGPGYVDAFAKLCRRYPNFYGDTAALSTPIRSFVYDRLVRDELLLSRLVHGSDFPIPNLPLLAPGVAAPDVWSHMRLRSEMERDVRTKRAIGLPDAVFRRAAELIAGAPGVGEWNARSEPRP